jgi:hypothetical protein
VAMAMGRAAQTSQPGGAASHSGEPGRDGGPGKPDAKVVDAEFEEVGDR